jgi:hypothetical protein
MSKRRKWLHAGSISLLTVPNLVYLICNGDVLKEANTIALTMTALLVLSVVGLGALAHFKANGGVWATLIGIFVLALSNIAYVAGVALIIEGVGLMVDGYVFKPLIRQAKIKELEDSGKQVTYTRDV